MEYVFIFCICLFGTIIIKVFYAQLRDREKYIYYQILCSLMDKEKIVLKRKSGEEVSKEELRSLLDIKRYFSISRNQDYQGCKE